MQKRIIEYIKEMSPLFGPSTREEEVQQWLYRNIKNDAEVCGDALGNLWTRPDGNSGLTCALVAHADEIGIQIIRIEEPGIARFRKIGGLRASSLLGHRLRFKNRMGEKIVGIIGSDPMQNNGTDNGLLIKTSDLWIDIGVHSKKDFESRLAVGDFGVFDSDGVTMLSENRLCGKALDDRSGLAVALDAFHEARTMKNLKPMLVSTVQEELSLFGAKALPVDADVAIVIDVDFCSDTPSDIETTTSLDLGKGVGICISADTSPIMLEMAKKISSEQRIPIQITLGRNFSGGTDAAALRLKKAAATIVIGIPLRYMHTACEMIDIRDIVYARRMVSELLKQIAALNNKTDLIPWE
jgi:endoglucanase